MKSTSRKILSLLLALVLILPFMTITARAEGEEKETVEVRPVSLNIQYRHEDGRYEKIAGAIAKAKNNSTGEEYTFEMGADASVAKNELPLGTYTFSVVSIPDEFAKGKNLNFSQTRVDEVKKGRFNLSIPFIIKDKPLLDVSLNTQLEGLDGSYTNIPNAVSKAVNKETGVEYIFTMDEKGNIPHNQLPEGTYKVSIVSVPDDFAKGKNLDTSVTYEKTVTSPDNGKGWTIRVKELPAEEETPETKKVNFGSRLAFRNLPGKEYESLEKTNTPYKFVNGAEIKITNAETGKEYTFTTDKTGSHQKVEVGKYTIELVDVPKELKGRFEWPKAREIEINTSSAQGFNVVEIIPTVDVSLNTQYMDLDRNFSRIPNAVSKAVNTETGETFIFTMDEKGNIPHLRLPEGTYELSLVSLPDEFKEGKKLDTSFTDTVTIKEPFNNKGWKVTVKELPADAESENPGEEKVTVDVSLNTQYMDLDRNFSRIPNAVSKAVNTETGEEYIFTMDAEGNIPHLQLPAGTYKLSLVSLPEEFTEGKKLDTSFTDTVTIEENSRAKGWTVTVKELPADEEPEVKKYQIGLEVRDLENKKTKVTVEVLDKDGKVVKGDFNEILQYLTDDLDLGTYTIKLSNLPENTKAVINENTFNKAKETENKNEFTLEVSKENLITALSNRVWGAFKLVEDLPVDEEPETPAPGTGDDDQTPAPGTGDDDQTPAPGTGYDDNTGTNPTPEKSKTPEVNKVTEGDKKITGKGEPESDIVVELPDGTKLEGKVDKDGNWTVEIPADKTLKANDRIKVTQTEKGKTVSNIIEIVVSKKTDQKVDEKETEKPGKDGKAAPKTGDAGVMLTSAVTALSAAAYVFTRKRKED
ncbi:Ig-like domain-containing protein [Helcococcus massiliensis]|uniref:Ig-like domain-containing protein n=1 Tax=Helcococcus massiliensis TaxID=2040290 RepID=UPI000CDE6EEC|nr:Ig-like domain-containing protein [Helcococcus massiliensis]